MRYYVTNLDGLAHHGTDRGEALKALARAWYDDGARAILFEASDEGEPTGNDLVVDANGDIYSGGAAVGIIEGDVNEDGGALKGDDTLRCEFHDGGGWGESAEA